MNPIQQPPKAKVKVNGVTLEIAFRPGFAQQMNERFAYAQKAFDIECLRLCNDNYVPYIDGTNIVDRSYATGEGQVVWVGGPAAHLYYHPEYNFTQKRENGLCGGYWGQRMKADNLDHLQKFASTILGKDVHIK